MKSDYQLLPLSSSLFSSQLILLQTDLVVDGRPWGTYLCFWPVWWTPSRGLVETWDTACRRSLKHDAGSPGRGSFREPWTDESFRHPGYSEGPDQTHPLNLEIGGEVLKLESDRRMAKKSTGSLRCITQLKVYLVCVQVWRTERAFQGRGEGRRLKASHLDKSYCRLYRCGQHAPHGLMGKDRRWPNNPSFIISNSSLLLPPIQIWQKWKKNTWLRVNRGLNLVHKQLTNSVKE